MQLGSIEIPNKFSHSGRNAPIVVAAGDRNQKKTCKNYYKNNPPFVNQF